MEKVFPKSCLFVTLPSDSLQFQKQLLTKSETRFGFKPLGNHYFYFYQLFPLLNIEDYQIIQITDRSSPSKVLLGDTGVRNIRIWVKHMKFYIIP